MDLPFRVDAALCRKDGICAQVCPVRIIKAAPGELPAVDERLLGRCIGCGQCMAFCPTRACSGPGLRLEDSRPLVPDLYPSPDQVEELVFSRRTIRNFRVAPVPREIFARILDAIRYAPTGKNEQAIRWVVLEGRAQTRALLELVIGWLAALPETDPDTASAVHAAGVARAWDKGLDILSREAPHAVVTVGRGIDLDRLDGTIYLTYFEILARAHGIGCCWSGYLTRALSHPAAGPVREFLGIGPGENGVSAQFAGFPKFRAVSRPPRRPLRVTWK